MIYSFSAHSPYYPSNHCPLFFKKLTQHIIIYSFLNCCTDSFFYRHCFRIRLYQKHIGLVIRQRFAASFYVLIIAFIYVDYQHFQFKKRFTKRCFTVIVMEICVRLTAFIHGIVQFKKSCRFAEKLSKYCVLL